MNHLEATPVLRQNSRLFLQGDGGTRTWPGMPERVGLYASFALLFVCCTGNDFLGDMAKLLWLASLAAMCFMNWGAAFGLFLSAAAVFSVLHLETWGSVYERPDNYALAVFVLAYGFTHLRNLVIPKDKYLCLAIFLFLALVLGQFLIVGPVTRENFAWIMRSYGIPLIVFLLLQNGERTIGEFRAFSLTLLLLGIWISAISILEFFGSYAWIIPSWIADPEKNIVYQGGRSGGLFMQSEWNGFALTLIYVFLLGRRYLRPPGPWREWPLVALCLTAIYFTNTRAAWIAALCASLLLFTPPRVAADSPWKRAALVAFGVLVLALVMLFPTQEAVSRVGDEGSVYYRINLWHGGLKMAAQKPLLGFGFGQFRENIFQYHEPIPGVPYTPIPSTGQVAHNTIVHVLVEHGLIGLLLYGWIFLRIVTQARKSLDSVFPGVGNRWVLVFALVYLINGQFIVAYELVTNLLFYGTLGLIAGLEKTERAKEEEKGNPPGPFVCPAP